MAVDLQTQNKTYGKITITTTTHTAERISPSARKFRAISKARL